MSQTNANAQPAQMNSSISEKDIDEFSRRLAEAQKAEEATPVAERYVDGVRVVWAPQPGSQERFMACPIFEALYHGTRGPGKTDALLMSFAQNVGAGWGSSWRGIIFRETYPQLADLVAKSEKWFPQIFPGQTTFNRQRMAWEWRTGETLQFRHMRHPDDYWNYHGHEFTFIGWEELTNWADPTCYKLMLSCCRSTNPDVPRMVRSTTNPYGVGHNWIKQRFRLHGQWWKTQVITDAKDIDGNPEPPRVAIHGHINENKILLAADPQYKTKITAAASSKAQKDAWGKGSWKIVAGGMLDDVWSETYNNVGTFKVPHSWRIDRAFDWGSAKPFSVGWYAESDGSDLLLDNGRVMATVRGDVFRVEEWYGWTGVPNQGVRMLATEVAAGIIEREILFGWREDGGRGSRVRPGPADSAIYTSENGESIGIDMEKPVRINGIIYPGVSWTRADKSPGSRKSGWEKLRTMTRNAAPPHPGGVRESPGFFVVGERCPQFLRTVPSLPRDKKDQDDVDSAAEDHTGDEVRYRLRSSNLRISSRPVTGNH